MQPDYVPTRDALAGRAVLVTGAGDGIGRAAALACAQHGATMILLGRTKRKLEAVYDEIEQSGGPQPAIYPLNLEAATRDDYAAVAETVTREFGRLDGLVHNAAELGDLSPLAHYDPVTWARVMHVNVTAAYLLTQACVSLLRRAPDGAVVFTTDGVAREPRPFWGAYAVSKAAVRTMMQLWATELDGHPSLRFNAIEPGPTRTRLRARAYPGEKADTLPLPQRWMRGYIYLLAGDSRGTTGTTLRVAEIL